MPQRVLEVAYVNMNDWVIPLRAAIDATPALAGLDASWQTGPLSDLAFAISTHRSCIPDIILDIDEAFRQLGEEFDGRDRELDELCREGRSYSFSNYTLVRRALIGGGSFIAEARACFEKLARFYRIFMRQYFSESVGSDAKCYDTVAAMAGSNTTWATALQEIRHDVLHGRSLWLAFQIVEGRRRHGSTRWYEPLFLLNWRPGAFVDPRDTISIETLRAIAGGVGQAALGLRGHLIEKVIALR